MISLTANADLCVSAKVHLHLIDEFIRMAEIEQAAAPDGFVRESVGELIDQMRQSRAGYAMLAESAKRPLPELAGAA